MTARPENISRWGYRLPKPPVPCTICGEDTLVHGYTYGACNDCARRAIKALRRRKERKTA